MSVLRKFGTWLLTENGKKFVFGVAVAGGLGTGVIKTFPDTVFINQYVDIVRFYKNGFSVPLTQPVKDRFNKALDLLEIPDVEKLYFTPFFTIAFDAFSAGTIQSKFGAAVGIPYNFTYIDNSLVDTSIIKLRQESVPWDVDDGKLLYKSLFLSEKAQIYAMAREIEMCRTYKFLIDAFLPISSYILAYGVGHNLNLKFNLYNKPRSVRVIMYVLVSSFMFINYCLLKDSVQLYYEKKIDEKLKEKNEIFKEGGKEYYEKMLSRNISLRGLLGKEGRSKFSPLGNENYLIRQPHLPLVQRKEFFESM